MELIFYKHDRYMPNEVVDRLLKLQFELDIFHARIFGLGFPGYDGLDVRPSRPESRKEFLSSRKENETNFIVAIIDGTIIGFISFTDWGTIWRYISFAEEKLKSILTISQLVIDTKYRNAGAGHALMDQVFIHANQINCKYIKLGVLADNYNARRFYSKLGFYDVCPVYVHRVTPQKNNNTWYWNEIDPTQTAYKKQLTKLIEQEVDYDVRSFYPMESLKFKIIDNTIRALQDRTYVVYGCNNGADGYLIGKMSNDIFVIWYLIYPDKMWSNPRNIVEATKSIDSCISHARWSNYMTSNDKIFRHMESAEYRSISIECRKQLV